MQAATRAEIKRINHCFRAAGFMRRNAVKIGRHLFLGFAYPGLSELDRVSIRSLRVDKTLSIKVAESQPESWATKRRREELFETVRRALKRAGLKVEPFRLGSTVFVATCEDHDSPRADFRVPTRGAVVIPVRKSVETFQHSSDYRSIVFHGESYLATPRQAEVIQLLHEAHTKGLPGLADQLILETIDCPGLRLRDLFRGSALWGKEKLIISPGKGIRCLNLPRG